jgi:hypothetical protein
MNNEKDVGRLIEYFIQRERETSLNPFISTRIMGAIGTMDMHEVKQVWPVWKTAMVAMSLIAAVFTGIATGSLYQPQQDAKDIVLMNDDSMENFAFYSQMSNE